MKFSKRLAVLLAGLSLTAAICALPASAKRNDAAYKAANYWAVQTYMNQQAQRGMYGNPYYNNYNNNYGYNPYATQYANPYGYGYNGYNSNVPFNYDNFFYGGY